MQIVTDRCIAMDTGSLTRRFTCHRDVGKYVLAARIAARRRKGGRVNRRIGHI
jgi:hypothetical protein